ncbi:MAG TPA: hypothetical protein VL947_01955, partial [Cytophagales bacterium]|nr:hypothetical protein [Cytophagales bacterium]
MKKTTILGILVGMFIGLQSQDIPIGAWRTHFAGRLAKTGALVKNEIFVGCQMGLYSYNLDTKTYKTYSKSDGISGYQLNKIVMDSTSGNLILTYADGNIDFYKNGSFTNIPDFFNYDFSGSKATNHINVSKGIAYISTNAGLLLININNMEVKETYSYIGPNASLVSVLSSAVKEDSLFISTNQGIMVGKLSPAVNLQNYNKWKMVPGSGTGGSIISFGGKIYTIINNQVHT